MDLLQAEAVADLVDGRDRGAAPPGAAADRKARSARCTEDGRDRLLRLLAQQEALIDFPDEDLPTETEAAMLAEIGSLRREIGGPSGR